jgi:hypothetical protein
VHNVEKNRKPALLPMGRESWVFYCAIIFCRLSFIRLLEMARSIILKSASFSLSPNESMSFIFSSNGMFTGSSRSLVRKNSVIETSKTFAILSNVDTAGSTFPSGAHLSTAVNWCSLAVSTYLKMYFKCIN